MVEDMLSADDVSCSSSQVSAKSEKNMADFDGEESGCEEELVQINSHAELSSHLQQHLPNLASIYHEHLVQGTRLQTRHKHRSQLVVQDGHSIQLVTDALSLSALGSVFVLG